MKWIVLLTILILNLTGCQTMGSRWDQAAKTDTEEAYLSFLGEYRESKYATRARRCVDEFRFEKAKKHNTSEGFEAFLAQCGTEEFATAAKRLAQPLFYEKARREDSVNAYQDFLQRYPSGSTTDKVRSRMNDIQRRESFLPAATNGNVDHVESLISEGLNVNSTLGAEALVAAVQGAADEYSIQMVNFRVIGMERHRSKNREGCLHVAKRLLESGVDPNSVRIQGYKPASKKHLDLGGDDRISTVASLSNGRVVGAVIDYDLATGTAVLYTTGKPGKAVPAMQGGITVLQYAEQEHLEEFAALLRH